MEKYIKPSRYESINKKQFHELNEKLFFAIKDRVIKDKEQIKEIIKEISLILGDKNWKKVSDKEKLSLSKIFSTIYESDSSHYCFNVELNKEELVINSYYKLRINFSHRMEDIYKLTLKINLK